MAKDLAHAVWKVLPIGARVRVADGPWKGTHGTILARLDNRIDGLGFYTVELDEEYAGQKERRDFCREWLTRIDATTRMKRNRIKRIKASVK